MQLYPCGEFHSTFHNIELNQPLRSRVVIAQPVHL